MLPREFAPVEATGGQRLFQVAITVLVMVLAIGGGALATIVLVAPRTISYRIVPGTLVIHAAMGPFKDHLERPLDDIAEARRATVGSSHKRNGTDASGYCVGRFRAEGLGDVWQATDCGADVVALFSRSGREPVLVTPADPDAFIAAIRNGGEGSFAPRTGTGRGFGAQVEWLLALLAPVIPLFAIFLALYLFLSPRRLRYIVEPGQLTVKTWLVTRRVPLGGAYAKGYSPGLALRLAGTALPGYYAGLFRADGANLRVYATATKEGVLVESDRRVYVSPAERDAFLGALREAGARVA